MNRRNQNSKTGLGDAIEIAMLSLALFLALVTESFAQAVPPTCPAQLGTESLISHDFSVSFCELCDVGTVRIEIENPFGPSDDLDFSQIVVQEDLLASGLTYVVNSTNFSGSNIVVPSDFDPIVAGAQNQNLTWDFTGAGLVMDARPGGPGNRARLNIEFQVERDASVTEEGLVAANRDIEASLDLTPSCAPGDRFSTDSGADPLPLREPEPQIIKLGRNVDAGQGSGSYADPVYGHEEDDVIWRIEVRNSGQAPLQDFKFSDSIVPGNFDINYVCDSEGDANNITTGTPDPDCVALPGTTTSIADFDVRAAFGGAANPYIVAPANGSGFYYLVGKITNSCENRINTVSNVEWGCQSEPPTGGIAQTSGGQGAGDDALLSTFADENNLDIDVALRGVNTGQPMGATGTVIITITNNSGGTVRGGVNGLNLRSVLPAEYVIDSTFTPTITTAPAYGNSYPGMVDTLQWTNPAAGTFPLVTADPALPLSNTDLSFDLTSSTANPVDPTEQVDMIRHGDVVTIRYRTVLIDPQYYDFDANLDVRQEAPNSDPLGTDPDQTFAISSLAEFQFEEFCSAAQHTVSETENTTANPEDLDIDIIGGELVFILTNTGDPLPLTVRLRNRGGHRATDYFAYVTFGEAMTVQTVPPGCTPTTNPAARPIWTIPVSHPPTATVYQCDGGVIGPGAFRDFTFEVVKNTAASFDDDLTFRGDVIGEITLSDDTPLWFPTPAARVDGITDRANDYSVDGIWARVIGYNLFKTQLGFCTENNGTVNDPDIEIEIGEECSFHIESGGWFGFETPGFTYIAVQNIEVEDQLPDGQGYISSTNPLLTSTPAILGVSLNPPPTPLDDAFFDWTFNTVVPDERILEKDHWFRADVTTRMLNDPIDTRAAPNVHADLSSNIMSSTFDAVFFNQVTSLEEVYNLGPNTLGFPREVHRRVDLTVTEPNLIVTKEVCNETRYGIGSACSNFVTLADDGDAFDTYVFRITVENEEASSGVDRAPAYDVTITSVTDPSDRLFVDPLTADGLDNDGDDPLIDAGDLAGEGTITDNTVQNATPAQIIASYTHSDALLRIASGESVELYYRVDPDDDVAPMQQLRATATASYDSLEGASGAQTTPQGANGEIGGARQYVSEPGQATIQIIPVEVPPKQILNVSNSGLVAPVNPQPVVIGEEIEYQIRALIPVAQLRNFMIQDTLPNGVSCAEAPDVDLDEPPYQAARFMPGGRFTPTCSADEVIWNFGDQTVTQSNRVDRRFDFGVQFIARVDNASTNRDGVLLRNGGTATTTEIRYVNELGVPITLTVDEVAAVVREPQIDLVKTFSVAVVDAGDLPRVTVEATNSGTATAYNLRVMDDLSLGELRYAGTIQGVNPPIDDVVTLGPDRPIFSWPAGITIAPGETIRFSFAVEVADDVEPEQVLSNTIQSDWTSLPSFNTALNSGGQIGPDGEPTGMRNGALPNAGNALNDYESEAMQTVPVAPVDVDKTDLDPTRAPEIGSHRAFQVEIQLPEGRTRDVVVQDDLDFGAVSYVLSHNADFDISYEFVGITTINGLPPSEAAFTAIPADGTSGIAVWAIGTVETANEDDLAVQAIDPVIRIRYFARLNNDLVTNVGSALQNSASVNSIHGETGLQAVVSDTTAPVVAIEPALTATKTLSNVTPGKLATDPPAFNDVLQYVVMVVGGGNATAWDVNIVDTLPPELALSAGFTPTASIDAVPVAGFVALPAGGPDGPLVWGRQNGDDNLDIGPGSFLELTYQVDVRAPPADGSTIENNIYVDWTSLEAGSVYERTGDGCPTITPPNDYCFGPAVATGTVDPAPPAIALLKENTQPTAAVGESFRYRITIPETPYAFPIYDVRIFDDLAASAADLRFLSVAKVSGSATFTPVNVGTPTNLILEDSTVGIDIPAGEQVVLEIEVVLEDTPTNVSGLTFTNTANYSYRWLDGNMATQRPGTPDTTADMAIVGPDDVTLEKSGPTSMTLGFPATFTLNVHNIGTAPAWNLTIFDRLANTPVAGTCDTPPSAFSAQVFEADGTTPVSPPLVEGTDFSVVFRPDPDCDFTLSALSSAVTIAADQRLIVTYDAVLDPDSNDGEDLTNVAGATEWFSADGSIPATAGDRRMFSRTVTDGSVGTLDHEDAYTATVALPGYLFEKTVMNVTTSQDPATTATPGDRLRYRLRVENLVAAPLTNLSITDVLDRLNAIPVFEPGSLVITSFPAGADISNTNATGGAAGTGVIDVRGMNLAGMSDSLTVEFEVTLADVIADGTVAMNQSQLLTNDVPFAESDDPNVGGPADPFVDGDEDPTQVTIDSAPDFLLEKVSADVTGDPAVLLAGETLRYTITAKNIGTDSAADAVLRDSVPVNTSYVAGSTSLNGVVVADAAGGVSPLSLGIPIHAPENATPGAMRADTLPTANNVATIVFDVVIDPTVIDGTIISNQAFVSAIGGGVSDQPSDDPGTIVPDDPTLDVVGNLPLLFAPKSATLLVDGGTIGSVDPGDVLLYTIQVYNQGAVVATEVVLQDQVPNDTTYRADTLRLNGSLVGAPGATLSPLVAGIPISSDDLPLPVGPTDGTLSIGGVATVIFEVMVNTVPAPPAGTLITNQATVETAELPDVLTDGDGNPATGPEPTVVVVGDGQQLAISKTVSVVGGGPALAGSRLEYIVRVINVSTVPANDVVLTDDLDQPVAGQLAYVPGSALLNGATTGVSVLGSLITADYSTTNGPLAPGAQLTLRFFADLDPGLAIATSVTNTGTVSWNAASQMASASVTVAIGGTPGVGTLNGAVWHDRDFDDAQGGTELALDGWIVDLRRNGVTAASTTTDASGAYRFTGVAPNVINSDVFSLLFRAPDAGANTASLGFAASAYTNGPQQISDIPVTPGGNLLGLDLPIDPSGVVYDAVLRAPVPSATLNLLSAASGQAVSPSCFADPNQQGQVTASRGYYKFDLIFGDATCLEGDDYLIEVVAPAGSFNTGTSAIIPPQSAASTAPFDVPGCLGNAADAIPTTAQHCEVQTSELAPPPTVPARTTGTAYQMHLTLDATVAPGSSQIFNNHIPLDPVLGGAVSIIKTTPKVNVSRGDLVPYQIVFNNSLAVPLADLSLFDNYPPGFRYIEGSARVDGVAIEPTVNGRQLEWTDLGIDAVSSKTVVLLLGVGAGVTEGEFVNRAQVASSVTGLAYSGVASATVRVVPDPTFDCTDVLGKVFDDRNRDGEQDEGERGLAGVRLVTVSGLAVQTDPHGRFHITCAVVPNETRGSNFVLKLDDRTLPSGYRMTTRQTQVKRATRGKALGFRFGATISRVVGLDVADAVFEPGTSEMRAQWTSRLPLLLDELEKAESILRLSYLADLEPPGLVRERLAAIESMIRDAWKARGHDDIEVETEVFWRRGESDRGRTSSDASPPEPIRRSTSSLPPVGAGPPGLVSPDSGLSGERHHSTEIPPTLWSVDPEVLEENQGDEIETRTVVEQNVETIKLRDVVPPIRFESGVAEIAPEVVDTLRQRLREMHSLRNVRLHLVGHADDQALSARLRARYGDNEGLSRERAGEVAELLQSALSLPPESISYSWVGETQPIALNTTPDGRAQNRRVEIEIWYDELEQGEAVEEVVVSSDIKRFKVCRTETVCMLRYREGEERRARLRNLIRPLNYDEEVGALPDHFLQQIREALTNLRDKRNVTVKIIAHTDDLPLEGRAARIYGNPLSLSRARAHRVALQIKDALRVPTAGIASDGRGASQPVASNATPRGRALNRRIEVEFWYDDPLLELPGAPQMCPDASDAELVTRIYEPAWGGFEPMEIVEGEARIPSNLAGDLVRGMDEVASEKNVRLRFIGYTANERLTRRMAEVYGDDIGLSADRARRTMKRIQEAMGLEENQVEHVGRGFVQADDVVNGGFIQGDTSHVVVQVVYDELAVLDDHDGIEATPMTRELEPKNPLSLNLMRITVDGVPIDDPERSSADIQRCTDVALDTTDIQFTFDDLRSERRLSVTAVPGTVALDSGEPVRFRMASNYPHFIERSEVRVFDLEASPRSEPLAIVPIGRNGMGRWNPGDLGAETPKRALKFMLRAYGEKGQFDETAPQSLWLVPSAATPIEALGFGAPRTTTQGGPAALDGASSDSGTLQVATSDGAETTESDSLSQTEEADPVFASDRGELGDELLAGYGESEAIAQNIEIGSAGTVRVAGSGIPAEHSVWIAGTRIPTNDAGDFVGEVLLPEGLHTVEVAVLDEEGNGELFLRDLEFARNDWFFVGIADLTLSADLTDGPPSELGGNNSTNLDSFADGRLAFFTTGKFGKDWKLTAQADTGEGPVEDLFTNFLDKSPEALFRRLDPDYHYPTFGDDSTLEEQAPTLGKFYAKLSKNDDYLLWGNFVIRYQDNELALVERGLYGGNLHYQSDATTGYGERRYVFDAFAADPGTIPSREEFRGTGGSVYFLQQQDLLIGSERLRIEIRDKASGLVVNSVPLQPELDYDIDYLQGRVLLSEPLSTIADDRLLVRSDGLSGNDVVLVVQYEYTPGFDELNTLNLGAQAHAWITDFLRIGATANRNEEDGTDNSLYAADLTLRKDPSNWLKLQAARSSGLVSDSSISDDGGYTFDPAVGPTFLAKDAFAYRADLNVGLPTLFAAPAGTLSLYGERREAGYSAAGLATQTDTLQAGGLARMPLRDDLDLTAKVDWAESEDSLETLAAEVDIDYALNESWGIQVGVRHDERTDNSPVPVATQEVGDRTDAVVQIDFDTGAFWRAYTFGQATVQSTEDREDNNRGGIGGSVRISDQLEVDGEVSQGDLGLAAQVGTTYEHDENTKLYLNYALDNERGYDGLHEQRGSVVLGTRSRLTDSASVYVENQYQHSAVTGLTRSMGINYAPSERWTTSVNWEDGSTHDHQTNAETDRRAGGVSLGYRFKDIQASTGAEYIYSNIEQTDGSRSNRTTWLFRNNLKYQMNADGRLILKFNYAISDSSEGNFFDGGFTEAVLGYAYRPIAHDRLYALAKYTYFYNVPSVDQVGQDSTPAQYIQKSHVAALDVSYDLTRNWTVGGKYAYRLSQVSLERENTDFFDNNAHLAILRVDWRFLELWEGVVEGRLLELPDLDERKAGSLVTLYRYVGDNLKIGVGYNFTDFSEDLTDLSYDHHGVFFNIVGSF